MTVTSSIIADTPERAELRSSVAKLAGRYGRSYFQDVVRRGAKPDELWGELGAAGYLGVHLPVEHGGGGGGLGDLAVLVVARASEAGADGRHPLSLMIVPTSSAGLSMQPIDAALQLPEKQFTLFFDDVAVERSNLIGAEGAGLRQVFAGLNPERIAAACVANGIARYALDVGTAYARDRTVWSTPIGAHQGIAHPLARAYMELQSSRLMTMRAAELADTGQDAAEASNLAKFAAGQVATNALDRAIQTHGGNGLSNDFGLADLWFIARMFRTAPVSEEMILNHVAQHSLGLPKSY